MRCHFCGHDIEGAFTPDKWVCNKDGQPYMISGVYACYDCVEEDNYKRKPGCRSKEQAIKEHAVLMASTKTKMPA